MSRLEEFLTEENIFKKFKNEFHRRNPSEYGFNRHARTHRIGVMAIASAFEWESTRDGFNYWSEINSKYIAWIKK